MKKQAIIVGLGQFGMSLARALTDRNVEVLAVDRNAALVEAAATFVSGALCFDATDEEALAQTAPQRRDLCVCAIGLESRDATILCTALMRQMGAPRVIARTNDPLHERILRLVGAHEVVNPEREFGQQYADHLAYEQVIGGLSLGADVVITKLAVPEELVGKTLAALGLPKRFNVTVVALQRKNGEVLIPSGELSVEEDDMMVLVAKRDAIQRMTKELES